MEEEKKKEFVAQTMAGAMKHGGGGRDSQRGFLKLDDWQGRKEDRDRRDKGRSRDRDRERGDKLQEKLDTRKLQVFLKQREKSEDCRVSKTAWMYIHLHSAGQMFCKKKNVN